MTDPQPESKPKKSRNSKAIGGAVGGGVAAVAVIVLMFVPLIPISYQETYQTTQTKATSYQEMETKRNTLFSVDDFKIVADKQYTASAYVKAGHRVEFIAQADDTVNAGIYSRSGQVIATRENSANIRLGFTPSIDDTYTFVVHNPHSQLFGLITEDVTLNDASATESWDELVTKSRQTTEPVTESRTVTKNVTLLELITSGRLG